MALWGVHPTGGLRVTAASFSHELQDESMVSCEVGLVYENSNIIFNPRFRVNLFISPVECECAAHLRASTLPPCLIRLAGGPLDD